MKKFKTLSITVIIISALLTSCSSQSQTDTAVETTTTDSADKGYRYWGYFQAAPGDTQWTPAMTGPSVKMADGAVEGWAFTFSGGAVPDASAPTSKPDFDSICSGTNSIAGKKRVGVFIDFGASALAPDGETPPNPISTCVLADEKAVGADVLSLAVKEIKSDKGMVCGISGYPKNECGVEIPTPAQLKK